MEVKEIVDQFLKREGYDGLYSEGLECSCVVGDLAPCGNIQEDCRAGYKIPGCSCGEGCMFHIGEITK